MRDKPDHSLFGKSIHTFSSKFRPKPLSLNQPQVYAVPEKIGLQCQGKIAGVPKIELLRFM